MLIALLVKVIHSYLLIGQHMNKMSKFIVATTLGLSALAAQATTINTTGVNNGGVAPFSDTNTATYGQTFKTVGTDTVLDSFSLYLQSGSNTTDFRAYVYQWNANKAVGQALYTSAINQFSGSGMTEFAFNTGGITLNSNLTYVAFLTTSGVAGGENGSAAMQFGTSYANGNFVYYNNGNDFNALTTHAWDSTGGTSDVWFKAGFSAVRVVPEPTSIALFGIALFGMGALRRRKQR
jgi:hypothetical protein